MDLFALIGVVIGLLTVVGAMILKHIPFSALNNPAAFVVIFAGTIASVMIATPTAELKNIGKIFGVVFKNSRTAKREVVIDKLVDCAKTARTSGLLALESRANEETDPFFSRALQLLVDGTDINRIEEYLMEDLSAMQQRHAGYANIFSQAGSYAPTLGVLGAVMGLIAALGDLSDMDRLSAAISAAFIATLLGIFTGYVLWHPMAARLKGKSRLEVQTKLLIISGVCSIAEGHNPNVIKENLLAYLTEKERKVYEGKAGKGES